MSYGQIIDEILDNTNQVSENSKAIKSVKNDIKRILYEMYGTGETPKKRESFPVSKTGTTTEDFEDSGEVNSNLDIGDLVVVAGYLEFLNVGDILTLNNQTGLTTVRIQGHAVAQPAMTMTENIFTLKSFDSHDNELQSETIIFTSEDVLDNTYELPLSDLAGGRVEFEFLTKDVNLDYFELTEIDWEVHTNSLQLPADVFVPLEVAFFPTTAGSNPYESKEFFAEDYMKWIPNKIANEEGSLTFTPSDFVANIWWRTEQNINYDNKMGYYLEYVDSRWTLYYKPTFLGLVTFYYSYFPSIPNISETGTPNLQEVFQDCLISGVTVRQLEKILLKVDSEIGIAQVRSAIGRWTPRYNMKLVEFTGHNKRKTETHVIKPNNILVDPGMNIL